MRKIIGIAIFVVIMGVFWGARPPQTSACVNWCEPICKNFNLDNSCAEYITFCCDAGGGFGTCDAGFYSCNRENSCCPIGDGGCECGLKADGSGCKPCAGAPSCAWDGRVWCPAGYQRTPVIVGSQCVRIGAITSCGLGSAQVADGCCEEWEVDGYTVCRSNTVYEYMCIPECGAGESISCTKVTGADYSVTKCPPSACNDADDIFVGEEPTSNRCYKIDAPGDSSDGEWVYQGLITCTAVNDACSCVSTCSAPTAPALTSPGNGAQRASTTATLTWSAATFDNDCSKEYRVYIDTSNPPTTLHATVDSAITTSAFTGIRGTTYYWYVQAVGGGTNTTSSSVRSFTILNNQITGQVFYDANNNCGGSGWSTGGVSVSVDSLAGTAVSGTGTFSKTAAVGASHTLSVNIPTGYACSTGVGCNTCSRSGIGSPSANNNFYLTDSRESWWQAEGAGIYAGGIGGVRSILPSSSLRLILAPVGGTEGLLMTNSGTVDIGDVGSVSDSGWRAVSRYRGKKMDYNYFAANMGVVRGQDSDWQSDTLELQADDGRDFWYMDPVGSTATIGTGSPWNVAGGDSYVIFVNGNLDINSDIVVAPGSFLALIVKGDVTVDPAVANLEGLYVIDGSFVTETVYVEGVVDDIQLTTGGTIVAWGSLSLSRSLGTGNITGPAEKFVYRSDLLTNMPDKMKTFVMQWNEVVPGTFEN